MLALTSTVLAYAPAPTVPRAGAVSMATKEELATALNPAIGYCAPAALQHRCKTEGSVAQWMQ